jgi:hypothetical protein
MTGGRLSFEICERGLFTTFAAAYLHSDLAPPYMGT